MNFPKSNNEQSLRIKELEDLLAKKDSAICLCQENQCRKGLGEGKTSHPTWQNRDGEIRFYTKTSSYSGWGKGLAEERSEEDLLELMGRMEGFDVYADKKMNVEYNKLFEKRYPYVEKISHGFRHSVSNLLKVYPDSPPSGQAPPNEPFFGEALSTSAPRGS
ncbi:hypothetical protein Tco_0799431 [Tanacetum coccineum]|uniref:Uncharacterized protein n=1 Tax=Tanacetum coccineum TaxID=301880 RepID=A0ABQ4ZUE1_9ASTR